MNIKEELNKLDQNTFNQYDLFNLYSSIKVDKELKEQVVGLIKESKCEELCKLLSEAYEKQTGTPLTEEAYDNLPEIEDKVKGVTDQVTAKAVKDHEKKQKNIKKGLEAADAEIKDEPFTSGENQPKPKKPEVPDALTEGYRGSTEVELISNGAWSDPELEWNGYTFNYWDIEDALWSNFLEDTGHTDNESDDPEVEAEFDKYVQENVVPYLEDVIAGGYFKDGSKHWTGNDIVDESVDADRPFEELDAIATEYYDNRDGESFNSFSDGELAVLWANCAITNANPWGQPYDDEVYEAIYKRPNKQEIFDKAREIALSFNAKDESLKEDADEVRRLKARLNEIDKAIKYGADPEHFAYEKNRIMDRLIALGCNDGWYDSLDEDAKPMGYEEAKEYFKSKGFNLDRKTYNMILRIAGKKEPKSESLKESETVDTGHYALWDEKPYTKKQLLYELNSDKMLEKSKGSFQVGHPDERDICAEILSDAGYEYEISGDGPWFHFEYWKTQE